MRFSVALINTTANDTIPNFSRYPSGIQEDTDFSFALRTLHSFFVSFQNSLFRIAEIVSKIEPIATVIDLGGVPSLVCWLSAPVDSMPSILEISTSI